MDAFKYCVYFCFRTCLYKASPISRVSIDDIRVETVTLREAIDLAYRCNRAERRI